MLFFFADDISVFSVMFDNLIALNILNTGIKLISGWGNRWKMCFNPDPSKQASEVIDLRAQHSESFISVACH